MYIESTAGPTESCRFRAVGHGSAMCATRHLSVLASLGAFLFIVCFGAGASWNALYAVLGGVVLAVVAWNVSRRLQLRGHRGRRGPEDVFVGVAVTTHRVVCMSAAQRAAPVVTVDRARSDLRGVSVGTTAPRWYVTPMAVVRLEFCDGTTIEFLTPGVETDGTESALRLAGIPVFDLDGAPRPRPVFDPTGFVASTPRRVSTQEQARAKLLSCGLLGVVLGASMFGGLYFGHALGTPGDRSPARVLSEQCVSQVVQAVGEGEQVVSVRFDSATEFGRGTLIVGAVQVNGSLGERGVDFTCAQQDNGIQVELAE